MKMLLTFCFLAMLFTRSSAQQRVILAEDFSSNYKGWPEQDNEKASAEFKGGKYNLVHHASSGSYLFVIDVDELDEGQDFHISTELTQYQGQDTDGFGLVWGGKDAGNFYGFNINAAGQYRVYQYKDENYKEIKSFTREEDFIKGKGLSNQLDIRKTGGVLSFYANEHFLYSTPFKGFSGNQVGFVLYNQTALHINSLDIVQEKGMPVVFEDSFEDNANGWIKDARDSAVLIQKSNKLFMRNEVGMDATCKLISKPIDPEKDFEVELNVRQLAGKKNRGYGMVWGAKDADNGFMFLINSFGSYAVFRKKEGTSLKLVNWTPSDQLLHLSVRSNKLVVRRTGEKYSFFLNDIWLRDIPFQSFLGDRLGLVLTSDLHIEAEYLAVREGSKSYIPKPPVITLVTPGSDELTIDTKALTYRAGVSSGSKITGVKLIVNGQQIPSDARVDPEGNFDVIVDQRLELTDGDNDIQLLAKNTDGLIQRSNISVKVNTPAQPVIRNANDYALFFATDDYSEWTDLVNPVNDVRTMARELEQNYGFNTELAIGMDRKEILKTLKTYAKKKYGPDDQLMIFFAGHGRFDEFFGEGYVVCANSLKMDEGNESYISHSSLRTIINNIPCRHIFLCMDVCFGGTIDPFIAQGGNRGNEKGGGEMTESEFIERKMKFKTRRYLTSGGKEYVPDGTPGRHSPFTRKFLEGLRNYGGHDKILTLGELTIYFERLLPEPRFGEFGSNEPGSDFLFIVR